MTMKRIVDQITVKGFISALYPFILMRKVTGAAVCVAIKKALTGYALCLGDIGQIIQGF